MRFGAYNRDFVKMQFVKLKDDEYYEKLKHSGMVVAKCLKHFKELVEAQTPQPVL